MGVLRVIGMSAVFAIGWSLVASTVFPAGEDVLWATVGGFTIGCSIFAYIDELIIAVERVHDD